MTASAGAFLWSMAVAACFIFGRADGVAVLLSARMVSSGSDATRARGSLSVSIAIGMAQSFDTRNSARRAASGAAEVPSERERAERTTHPRFPPTTRPATAPRSFEKPPYSPAAPPTPDKSDSFAPKQMPRQAARKSPFSAFSKRPFRGVGNSSSWRFAILKTKFLSWRPSTLDKAFSSTPSKPPPKIPLSARGR